MRKGIATDDEREAATEGRTYSEKKN